MSSPTNDNGGAPGRKRPITVTVSGERGSGKTTLIAVIAQALENSGHRVSVPPHTPNATTAIADLHEQFDISFEERAPGDAREFENTRAQVAAVKRAIRVLRESAHAEVEAARLLAQATDLSMQADKLKALAALNEREAFSDLAGACGLPVEEEIKAGALAEQLEDAGGC